MNETRVRFWRDRGDLITAKGSLQRFIAAWRAVQPSVESLRRVLDQDFQVKVTALLPLAPNQMPPYPEHRDWLDALTTESAGIMTAAESLISRVDALITRPALVSEEGSPNGHTPNPAA